MRVQHTGFTIDSQVVGVTDRNIVASPPPPPCIGIFVLSADSELLEGEGDLLMEGQYMIGSTLQVYYVEF